MTKRTQAEGLVVSTQLVMPSGNRLPVTIELNYQEALELGILQHQERARRTEQRLQREYREIADLYEVAIRALRIEIKANAVLRETIKKRKDLRRELEGRNNLYEIAVSCAADEARANMRLREENERLRRQLNLKKESPVIGRRQTYTMEQAVDFIYDHMLANEQSLTERLAYSDVIAQIHDWWKQGTTEIEGVRLIRAIMRVGSLMTQNHHPLGVSAFDRVKGCTCAGCRDAAGIVVRRSKDSAPIPRNKRSELH